MFSTWICPSRYILFNLVCDIKNTVRLRDTSLRRISHIESLKSSCMLDSSSSRKMMLKLTRDSSTSSMLSMITMSTVFSCPVDREDIGMFSAVLLLCTIQLNSSSSSIVYGCPSSTMYFNILWFISGVIVLMTLYLVSCVSMLYNCSESDSDLDTTSRLFLVSS